jgi:phasin family protein
MATPTSQNTPGATVETTQDAPNTSIRLANLMIAAGKRLTQLQVEATSSAISAHQSLLLTPATAGNSVEIIARWTGFLQDGGARAAQVTQVYFDIISRTQAEMNRILSDAAHGGVVSREGAVQPPPARSAERRVGASVISFPDRRIALAA